MRKLLTAALCAASLALASCSTLQEAIQEVVAENVNTAFVGTREGYNSGDFTHPSLACSRQLGTDLDACCCPLKA